MPKFRHINTPQWMKFSQPTTKVERLIPKIPFEVPPEKFSVRGGVIHERGPTTRLTEISKSLTHLIDEERIEVSYYRGYEVRQYAERLIVEAMIHGDCHRPTMEIADFYLRKKELIHKLFKVLVPRYLSYTGPFTSMYFIPYNSKLSLEKKHLIKQVRVVIELKDNPLPPLTNEKVDPSNFLTNILLNAAKSKSDFKKN